MPSKKYTSEMIVEMLKRLNGGERAKGICLDYGICQPQLSRMKGRYSGMTASEIDQYIKHKTEVKRNKRRAAVAEFTKMVRAEIKPEMIETDEQKLQVIDGLCEKYGVKRALVCRILGLGEAFIISRRPNKKRSDYEPLRQAIIEIYNQDIYAGYMAIYEQLLERGFFVNRHRVRLIYLDEGLKDARKTALKERRALVRKQKADERVAKKRVKKVNVAVKPAKERPAVIEPVKIDAKYTITAAANVYGVASHKRLVEAINQVISVGKYTKITIESRDNPKRFVNIQKNQGGGCTVFMGNNGAGQYDRRSRTFTAGQISEPINIINLVLGYLP